MHRRKKINCSRWSLRGDSCEAGAAGSYKMGEIFFSLIFTKWVRTLFLLFFLQYSFLFYTKWWKFFFFFFTKWVKILWILFFSLYKMCVNYFRFFTKWVRILFLLTKWVKILLFLFLRNERELLSFFFTKWVKTLENRWIGWELFFFIKNWVRII